MKNSQANSVFAYLGNLLPFKTLIEPRLRKFFFNIKNSTLKQIWQTAGQ